MGDQFKADCVTFDSGDGVEFLPMQPQYSEGQKFYVFANDTADGMIPGEVLIAYNDGTQDDNQEPVDLSFDEVKRLHALLGYVIEQREKAELEGTTNG